MCVVSLFAPVLADSADTGMPQEWQKLLDDNGITRAEQEQNPDQVRLDRSAS